MTITEPSPSRNAWRQETPGAAGWTRTARPDDPNKYFMVSSDCHANEPGGYLAQYIEPEYRHRIPRIEVREDGSEWMVTEGTRPSLVKAGPKTKTVQEQQSFERKEHNRHAGSRMDEEDRLRNATGRSVEQRLADQDADGVDVELIFGNKGLMCFASPDPTFALAMCRAWNRWAYDYFGGADGWNDGRTLPLAQVATGDQDGALAEVALGGRARLRRPVAGQLADLRHQAVGQRRVQRPQLRAPVVAGRGGGHSGHLPRVHRA